MMLFTTLLLSAFAAGYHLPEPPNCSEEELMNGYNYTLRGGWMDLSMYHTWPRDLNPPIWELSTELSTSLRRQAFARKKIWPMPPQEMDHSSVSAPRFFSSASASVSRNRSLWPWPMFFRPATTLNPLEETSWKRRSFLSRVASATSPCMVTSRGSF